MCSVVTGTPCTQGFFQIFTEVCKNLKTFLREIFKSPAAEVNLGLEQKSLVPSNLYLNLKSQDNKLNYIGHLWYRPEAWRLFVFKCEPMVLEFKE